ncbi:MAG TPA: hypothetical protein VMH37_18375 [Candidatus Binataceae bacterium]|nr:hypothetical protein [Candidatus Binataceae bacterium]
MPSEKAKENKALIATCVACSKPVSTETAVGLTGMEDGHRKSFTVCIPCANKGFRPPGFSGVYTVRPA